MRSPPSAFAAAQHPLGRYARWFMAALVIVALPACACSGAAKSPAASPKPAASDPKMDPNSTPKTDQTTAQPVDKPTEQPPTYLNPEEAQRRIDRFKEGIGRGPK